MMQRNKVNLLELGGKMRSKNELYRLLTTEGQCFLPRYKQCSVRFI